jgi:hypothetical protein
MKPKQGIFYMSWTAPNSRGEKSIFKQMAAQISVILYKRVEDPISVERSYSSDY